jgi:hypothetical protein
MTLGLARSLRKRVTYMGSVLLMVSEDCTPALAGFAILSEHDLFVSIFSL